ncbi:hypothetical protein THAR02_11113 [Trichoderma harzianum]|uniref:Uncharacterized protein n=1 Tax=Trichoderma harzianum TaxID=5544 RepID=A0A0F9X7I3_TRIHA|nr:hypothetical protein THAR02_11113 [Trichoderma harzianum]
MQQFFSLFTFSPSLFPLSHFPLFLPPLSLYPLSQSSPPSPVAPASPTTGLLSQSGDSVPYNSPSHVPPNRDNHLSTIPLHWPIATAAHPVIIHQTQSQPPRFPHINKWTQAIKHWEGGAWNYYAVQQPGFLWEHCWDQFNITKLPIFSEDEFFETAIEIATNEDVTNPEEFKKKFNEEAMSHQAELDKSFDEAWNQTVYHAKTFPCEDASQTVASCCLTRCYMDLIRLRGVTLGWKSDTNQVTGEPIDDHFNGDNAQYFVDDRYQGPTGDDQESTDDTRNSDTHSDMESTLNGKQSQRKRKKTVPFNTSPDTCPNNNNEKKSKRQKLDFSSLTYMSSSSSKRADEEKAAKRLKRQRDEVPATDPAISFTLYSSSEETEERPTKKSADYPGQVLSLLLTKKIGQLRDQNAKGHIVILRTLDLPEAHEGMRRVYYINWVIMESY